MEDILFIVACCLTPLGLAGVGFYLWRHQQQRTAGIEETAAALGLEKKIQIPGRLPHQQWWWYEGVWEDGRSFGFMPIGIQRANTDYIKRTATHFDPAMRLIVEVKVPKPLGVKVMRNINWGEKRPLDSFDSAFDVKNGEAVAPITQEALLNFIRQHSGTFLLSDRTDILDKTLNSLQIMEGKTAVLLHEYEVTTPDVETMRQKIEALVVLAQRIEHSQEA
ncbi:MAG: hypothetical protein AAF614_38555 [Chloroflexota bacterium]